MVIRHSILSLVFSFSILFIATLPMQPKAFAGGQVTQCATFDASSSTLRVPCLKFEGSLYTLDLFLNESGLDLVNSAVTKREDSVYYCSKYNFVEKTVHIPCVELSGKNYWVDLGLVSSNAVRFQLNNSGKAFDHPLLYNAGVSPIQGNSSTLFTFYVSYYDVSGMPPTKSIIYIDGVANMMTLMNGSESNGTYSVSTQLSEGKHSFLILFKDGRYDKQVLLDYTDLPEVTAGSNSPPSLRLATVLPVNGVENSGFSFYVNYSDADGDPPVTKQVILNNVTTYAMSLKDGSTSNGKYYSNINLKGGCYCYNFLFSDGSANVRFPSFGGFYNPAVDYLDTQFSPPTVRPVTCNNNVNPELFNGSVTPVSGNECTKFTFQIDYFDFDGNWPAGGCYVYIDGTAYSMSLKSGSSANGTYVFTTSLNSGTHSFYFYASDGKCGTARYPATGGIEGPTILSFSPQPSCS